MAGTQKTGENRTAGRNGSRATVGNIRNGNRATGGDIRNSDRVTSSSVGSNRRAVNGRTEKSNLSSRQEAYEAQVEAYVQEELKKREKRRKILILLCSVVAIGCLVYVGMYSYEDYRTKESYEQMSQLKEQTNKVPILTPEDTAPTINYTDTNVEVPEVLEEYKNLYNMNKKLIGWLKIDDTIIDYPVMQTSDNEYYLTHNINQEKDRNGALFLDKDCDVLKPSTNLIIYGHHMSSGRMFGNLDDYESESYYKKHSIIQFDTIYEKGTYEVMYVFRSKLYSEAEVVFKYYQFIECYSEQEFDSYMKEMAAMSLYDTGVTAKYGDRLLTLSTCDNSVEYGRFVVVAKRVEE